VCDALRSSLAHIRLQFDRNCGMELGVQDGDERHWTAEWMDARAAGTQTLQAKYPWLNFVDHGMYLTGFEAGIRFGIRSRAEQPKRSESSESPETPVIPYLLRIITLRASQGTIEGWGRPDSSAA